MMSVKKAKEHCGYDPKPILRVCGNCGAFASDRELPGWMKERNLNAPEENYNIEEHGVEKNLRCSDHGFAVKKMASCRLWKQPSGIESGQQ